MRVDLRRRDVGVAEHLLQRAQVGAALEHVRREASAAACAGAAASPTRPPYVRTMPKTACRVRRPPRDFSRLPECTLRTCSTLVHGEDLTLFRKVTGNVCSSHSLKARPQFLAGNALSAFSSSPLRHRQERLGWIVVLAGHLSKWFARLNRMLLIS